MTNTDIKADLDVDDMPAWYRVMGPHQQSWKRRNLPGWAIPHNRKYPDSAAQFGRDLLTLAVFNDPDEHLRERVAATVVAYGRHTAPTANYSLHADAAYAVNDIGVTLLGGHLASTHIIRRYEADDDIPDTLIAGLESLAARIWPGDGITWPPGDDQLKASLQLRRDLKIFGIPRGVDYFLRLAACNRREPTDESFPVTLHHLMRDVAHRTNNHNRDQLTTALVSILDSQ